MMTLFLCLFFCILNAWSAPELIREVSEKELLKMHIRCLLGHKDNNCDEIAYSYQRLSYKAAIQQGANPFERFVDPKKRSDYGLKLFKEIYKEDPEFLNEVLILAENLIEKVDLQVKTKYFGELDKKDLFQKIERIYALEEKATRTRTPYFPEVEAREKTKAIVGPYIPETSPHYRSVYLRELFRIKKTKKRKELSVPSRVAMAALVKEEYLKSLNFALQVVLSHYQTELFQNNRPIEKENIKIVYASDGLRTEVIYNNKSRRKGSRASFDVFHSTAINKNDNITQFLSSPYSLLKRLEQFSDLPVLNIDIKGSDLEGVNTRSYILSEIMKGEKGLRKTLSRYYDAIRFFYEIVSDPDESDILEEIFNLVLKRNNPDLIEKVKRLRGPAKMGVQHFGYYEARAKNYKQAIMISGSVLLRKERRREAGRRQRQVKRKAGKQRKVIRPVIGPKGDEKSSKVDPGQQKMRKNVRTNYFVSPQSTGHRGSFESKGAISYRVKKNRYNSQYVNIGRREEYINSRRYSFPFLFKKKDLSLEADFHLRAIERTIIPLATPDHGVLTGVRILDKATGDELDNLKWSVTESVNGHYYYLEIDSLKSQDVQIMADFKIRIRQKNQYAKKINDKKYSFRTLKEWIEKYQKDPKNIWAKKIQKKLKSKMSINEVSEAIRTTFFYYTAKESFQEVFFKNLNWSHEYQTIGGEVCLRCNSANSFLHFLVKADLKEEGVSIDPVYTLKLNDEKTHFDLGHARNIVFDDTGKMTFFDATPSLDRSISRGLFLRELSSLYSTLSSAQKDIEEIVKEMKKRGGKSARKLFSPSDKMPVLTLIETLNRGEMALKLYRADQIDSETFSKEILRFYKDLQRVKRKFEYIKKSFSSQSSSYRDAMTFLRPLIPFFETRIDKILLLLESKGLELESERLGHRAHGSCLEKSLRPLVD